MNTNAECISQRMYLKTWYKHTFWCLRGIGFRDWEEKWNKCRCDGMVISTNAWWFISCCYSFPFTAYFDHDDRDEMEIIEPPAFMILHFHFVHLYFTLRVFTFWGSQVEPIPFERWIKCEKDGGWNESKWNILLFIVEVSFVAIYIRTCT